jgi:hypothetical protein
MRQPDFPFARVGWTPPEFGSVDTRYRASVAFTACNSVHSFVTAVASTDAPKEFGEVQAVCSPAGHR